MGDRNRQCSHCGYLFNDTAGSYYSEDFARHIDHKKQFVMQWCYNCNYVVVYRPAKLLGLIPLPFMKPKDEFNIEVASTKDISKTEDSELGGMAISHLMRSIWWSFLERAELSLSEEEAPKAALKDMIDKLPTREAALCLASVSIAHLVLPLAVQIERGKYLKEHRDPSVVLDEMLKEISKLDTEEANAVLIAIEDFR